MTKKHEDGFRLNRRQLLKGAASVGIASALSPLRETASAQASRDLIRSENEKAGTTDWLLQNTRVDPKTRYRCPWIEEYCSHTSIRAGGIVRPGRGSVLAPQKRKHPECCDGEESVKGDR